MIDENYQCYLSSETVFNMNTTPTEKNTHIGRNIKRIREIQGIKQEHFGQLCKSKYSQQRISDFENMIALDEPLLEELATALGVTPDFVKAFKEENVIYNIQNNSNSTLSDQAGQQYNQPNNNEHSEKLIQLLEKMIEEDRVKTRSIAELSKAILQLTNQVTKLKKED